MKTNIIIYGAIPESLINLEKSNGDKIKLDKVAKNRQYNTYKTKVKNHQKKRKSSFAI